MSAIRPAIAQKGKDARHTVVCVSDVHKSRRHRQEQDTVRFVLRAELGYDHVERGLAGRVQRAGRQVVLVGEVRVRQAGRDGDDLLGVALEDEREEEVEEVDVADDVGFEQVAKCLCELFRLLTPVVLPS